MLIDCSGHYGEMYGDVVGMGTGVMGMGWGWGEICGDGVGVRITSCPSAGLYSRYTGIKKIFYSFSDNNIRLIT